MSCQHKIGDYLAGDFKTMVLQTHRYNSFEQKTYTYHIDEKLNYEETSILTSMAFVDILFYSTYKM